MWKTRLVCMTVLLAVLILTGISCSQPSVSLEKKSQIVAEEFVKAESTYRFDGISDTFELKSTTTMGDGWIFIFQFDSRHAGYGDRSGQALAEVITPHAAEVTVLAEKVTRAIMDGQWDMINQLIALEIDLAPIHDVNVYLMKSNPPQIGVHIKGGLKDGCTKFNGIETTREGNKVNINVTTQHPKDVFCPAVYTYFEKDLNLGTDFAFGTTYTLNVNDYSTTFEGTLMKGEGVAD